MNWFDVDKNGLRKVLEARGKGFILLELLQNAWDQDVSWCRATLEPVPGRPLVRVVVEDDDPAGFADLSHAFTLFAESGKTAGPGTSRTATGSTAASGPSWSWRATS